MPVHTLEVGALGTCCHILTAAGQRECIVVDPGGDAPVILRALRKMDATPTHILVTHSHYDHIAAVDELLEAFPAALCAAHPLCAERMDDPEANLSAWIGDPQVVARPLQVLTDGECIACGAISLVARHTPGHEPGHMIFINATECYAIVGDLVFAGSVGRTDFPGCSPAALRKSIRDVILTLPDDMVLYPGHGPSTTVGAERHDNPFFS